ncbi:hypothetical protein [Brenneria alni]|uniref:hypothetical protein n=1 Tax=Brenneria alni TaxID=71656 RepID=UPI0014748EAA|nr:hypothetical protein [Brenneria alni]
MVSTFHLGDNVRIAMAVNQPSVKTAIPSALTLQPATAKQASGKESDWAAL